MKVHLFQTKACGGSSPLPGWVGNSIGDSCDPGSKAKIQGGYLQLEQTKGINATLPGLGKQKEHTH